MFVRCRQSEQITEPEIEVCSGFFTVLPLNSEHFYLFVNLGHLNPPGHTFPSGHGGFYLTDYMTPVPLFSPADMTVTRITRVEHVNKGYNDYDITLSVNNDQFKVVFGHMTSLHESLLDQITAWESGGCESYETGGDTYRRCQVWTDLPVSAGDTLGTAGGNPGQFGLDFGVFDRSIQPEQACSRFADYDVYYAVSPLNYFTDAINAVLVPVCGDYFCGSPTTRVKPPVGGHVGYDIAGTVQGLWFRQGEPTTPEDPHLALVYDNVDPDVPLFSVGTSLTGLNTGLYSFTPADTGLVDRVFSEVTSDGQIYRYQIKNPCWSSVPAGVLLVMMTSETDLKIEKQENSDGPPWQFTENAVLYER